MGESLDSTRDDPDVGARRKDDDDVGVGVGVVVCH